MKKLYVKQINKLFKNKPNKMNLIRDIISNYNHCPIYTKPKFVPFWNPEHYFNDLETHGTDSTHVRQLHENCIYPEPTTIKIKKKICNVSFMDKLPVSTIVKNDKVKIVIQSGLYNIYEKYLKKNKKAPIDEYVRALYEVGYSEDILLDVMKKDAKRKAMAPELEQFVFDVFGEFNDKKVVVKKKTIQQILKFKKKIYAMPEPEETPNEDYEPSDE